MPGRCSLAPPPPAVRHPQRSTQPPALHPPSSTRSCAFGEPYSGACTDTFELSADGDTLTQWTSMAIDGRGDTQYKCAAALGCGVAGCMAGLRDQEPVWLAGLLLLTTRLPPPAVCRTVYRRMHQTEAPRSRPLAAVSPSAYQGQPPL